MIDWLLKNKEWIFSGVGVAVVVGLPALHRMFRRPRQSATNSLVVRAEHTPDGEGPDLSSTGASTVERVSPISAGEIQSSIEAAPPLQRNAVADRYKNLRIEWDTELVYADNKDGTVQLQLGVLNLPAHTRYSVVCKVDFENYRELAVLPERAHIRVNGLVADVTAHWLSLSNARLTFLPPR